MPQTNMLHNQCTRKRYFETFSHFLIFMKMTRAMGGLTCPVYYTRDKCLIMFNLVNVHLWEKSKDLNAIQQ